MPIQGESLKGAPDEGYTVVSGGDGDGSGVDRSVFRRAGEGEAAGRLGGLRVHDRHPETGPAERRFLHDGGHGGPAPEHRHQDAGPAARRELHGHGSVRYGSLSSGLKAKGFQPFFIAGIRLSEKQRERRRDWRNRCHYDSGSHEQKAKKG
jgi:hypothetical protein